MMKRIVAMMMNATIRATAKWWPFAALTARNHRPGSLRRMASMRSQMALAAASGSIPA